MLSKKHSYNYSILIGLCWWSTLFLSGNNCSAQTVTLKNLSKIELITSGAWIDSYYKKVEVVFENNKWKSYQTRFVNYGPTRGGKKVNDSTRTFIQDVPVPMIKEFLSLTAKPDSIIHEELFKISTKDLIAHIDSNTTNEIKYNNLKIVPSPEWKDQFIKALMSKQTVGRAFYEVMHPYLMDDRSVYYIVITNNLNKTDTVMADAHGETYYLPWRLKGKESYNPDITKLYEWIGGNDSYGKSEKDKLYFNLIWELYCYQGFKAKLYWDQFKTDQPDVYKLISKTLIPLKFNSYKEDLALGMGYSGVFTSALLPSFMEFRCFFSRDYPQSTTFHNGTEKRLISWYKKGNFLFQFMKDHPHSIMSFSNNLQKEHFAEINKRYPEITKYDRSQIKVFTILENKDYQNSSLWLLLPDDKVVLIRYGGTLVGSYQSKFEIIPSKRYHWSNRNVCIVFNKFGKKIAGTEEPFDVKRLD